MTPLSMQADPWRLSCHNLYLGSGHPVNFICLDVGIQAMKSARRVKHKRVVKEDAKKSQGPNDNYLGWQVHFPIRPLINVFEGLMSTSEDPAGL